MDKYHNSLTQPHLNWWRFLPYALFGILAFSLTSSSSMPIWLKSYLMILEIPVGLVFIYFCVPKLAKLNQNKHPSFNHSSPSIKL